MQHLSGYEQYFAMARGVEGTVALDMSKFFDTNYHYMVPELDNSSKPTADWSKLVEKVSTVPGCLSLLLRSVHTCGSYIWYEEPY